MSRQAKAAESRAQLISQSLKRHRLTFVQMGVLFEPLRDGILDTLGGVRASVTERDKWLDLIAEYNLLVVDDLDYCSNAEDNVLGEVRAIVGELLDDDRSVCLVSRAPRISYRSVPGSSVLEDAALICIPTLSESETEGSSEATEMEAWPLPAVTFGSSLTVTKLVDALRELGTGLVAALDHAIFEIDSKNATDGLGYLDPREMEGLRGSGLVQLDDNKGLKFTKRLSSNLLKEALSELISSTLTANNQLSAVTTGLWNIERTVRRAVRQQAVKQYGSGWRSNAVGNLKDEIVRRVQLEGNVAAKTIKDVRDPLEWVTLGELIEIVRSEKFSNIGVDAVIWRRMHEQLVPVRNRLAHVRMLKPKDEEIVRMWRGVIRDQISV